MVSERVEELRPWPAASCDAAVAATAADRRSPLAWVRRHLPGLDLPALPSGVALGLVATTAGITLLGYLTAPFGQGPTLANTLGMFLPTIGAMVVYATLARAHPRCRHDPARHVLALLAMVGIACAAKMLPLPWNAIVAIVMYSTVVHARMVCGRRRAQVATGALALGFLPLGPAVLTPGAFGVWLIGLLYIYASMR